ncbi:winged helix-turn-helix transcriptional regulator [soil metagenome]
MAGMRSYNDRCGIARALDVVGARWALLVVRELLLGPKRFTDLRAGLPHIGPDVLAKRLRQLADAGLLIRRTLDPPAASKVYELTERGQALEGVVLELGRWGSGVTFAEDEDATLGPDAFVLALKTMFPPAGSGGLETTIDLRLDGIGYRVDLGPDGMGAIRGHASGPAASIEGSPGDLARLLWHDGGPAAVLGADEVTIDGDRRVAKRFLGLFTLPVTA